MAGGIVDTTKWLWYTITSEKLRGQWAMQGTVELGRVGHPLERPLHELPSTELQTILCSPLLDKRGEEW